MDCLAATKGHTLPWYMYCIPFSPTQQHRAPPHLVFHYIIAHHQVYTFKLNLSVKCKQILKHYNIVQSGHSLGKGFPSGIMKFTILIVTAHLCQPSYSHDTIWLFLNLTLAWLLNFYILHAVCLFNPGSSEDEI